MLITDLLKNRDKSDQKEDHWIPLSDLMTGLMLMFLLIAVIFMLRVERDAADLKKARDAAETQAQIAETQADRLKRVAVLYNDTREQLYSDLLKEFETDLPKWRAKLDKNLAIRFEEPEVQFPDGEATLTEKFKAVLDSFMPRYVHILASEKYKSSIEEIRIEGHTSSVWGQRPAQDAYFLNMDLSQKRTRTTLQYILAIPEVGQLQGWMKEKITANGLSSSRLRFLPNGSEDQKGSQRVEIRVRLNADDRLQSLLMEAGR
jgi:outer membrane protein OmpA-like peptidoglycan-associated protein